jgi:thiol-disulfide isomerase/thioredoxin
VTDRPEFSHKRERHGVIGPFSGRQVLLAFAAIVAAVVILVGVTTPLGNTANGPGTVNPNPTAYIVASAPPQGLQVGSKAPEFEVPLPDGTTYQLTDLDGKPIRLADLRGKAVWLDFWATWCPPCQAEMPILRDMSERYADRGLEVVAVSVQESSPADVADYARRYELGYTIGFDASGDIFHAYRGFALPTQYFIDPNGVIASIVGAPLDEAGATRQIEAILPAGSARSSSAPSATARPSKSP